MNKLFLSWMNEENAATAIEAGFLFPLMLSILLGTIDVGVAVTVNQRLVNATHTMVDLLTRSTTVTNATLNDAVIAGRLAVMPYDTMSFGYDVAGMQLMTAQLTPVIQWHDTFNMSQNLEVTSIIQDAGYVGDQDEGIIAVTVKYTYIPVFMHFLTGSFDMQEVSFARGRKGGFVNRTL